MEYDTIITNIQDINFQYLLAENFTRNFYLKSSNDDAYSNIRVFDYCFVTQKTKWR